MHDLNQIIRYLRDFEIDEKRIKQCYAMIPDPQDKVDTREKQIIECKTQYDINSVGSFIENITNGIEKGYITKAIKKTIQQFSYVRQTPRLVFYIVVLSKVVK